jgi:hypothetical protein
MEDARRTYIRKMDAADPAFHPPTCADNEIKNNRRFLGCDPVKVNRTIRESAV